MRSSSRQTDIAHLAAGIVVQHALRNQGRHIAIANGSQWQSQIGGTGGKKTLQEKICNEMLIETRHVLMYS